MTKICATCEEPLPLEEFNKDSKAKDGLTCSCSGCVKLYNAEYYKKHSAKVKANVSNYYRANTEVVKHRMAKYQATHKADHNLRCKRHRDRVKDRPEHKLLHGARTRVYLALKGKVKQAHTKELLGCELAFLKKHLEEQFKPGMSWDNYGEWHVDHIKACASFDLSTVENLHKCFHYSNLQPLWAVDNLRKGCRETVNN